jgi:hypothetical protein
MIYLGHVKNGVVVLDEQIALPEGAQVKVDLIGEESENSSSESSPSLYERLKSVTGKAQGLPPDASMQVDHYLYGQPKQMHADFWRLLKQFAQGMLCLSFMSWIFCNKSLSGFFCIFTLLFCAINIAVGLAMVWMSRWAMRKESQITQFGISTMLLMLFYAGLYLGIIRWLMLQSPWGVTGNTDEALVFLGTAVIFTICSVAAIPFILSMTESLLWFAIWLQKKPWIRRLIVPFLSRRPK